ncbi:protein prkA [bacterium]|nr:protein prkA [bacterium]
MKRKWLWNNKISGVVVVSKESIFKKYIGRIKKSYSSEEFKRLNRLVPFSEFLDVIIENPGLAMLSHERIYNMIISHGTTRKKDDNIDIVTYNFFNEELYGIDDSLVTIVDYFKSSAQRLDTRKRILLLHGPVSGAKSTIVSLIKRGLEEYSMTEEGALYTLLWEKADDSGLYKCEMNESPLNLVPKSDREFFMKEYGIYIEGDLCPKCRKRYKELEDKYEGNVEEIYKHIFAKRILISEQDRIGIGTFQPADPKSQDMAELNGSVNYSKLGKVSDESDPDGWVFNGELNKANRGIMEFIEMLKADERFLYILLTLAQERQIKTPRFPLISADEVIIAHTNESEYKVFVQDPTKEALMDRIIKVDVKYNLRVKDEIRIYEKLLKKEAKESLKHISPNALNVAAMFAILTRLEPPKKMTLEQKMKLYNGESVQGFKEKDLKELKRESKREGLDGISPRAVVNVISNTMIQDEVKCLNSFAVLSNISNSLKKGKFPKINAEERDRYLDLIDMVRKELNEIAKQAVLKAFLASYEPAMETLCSNYLDHVDAYINKEKVKDMITGEELDPDETLMGSIEEKIGNISEARKDQFRASLMASIGTFLRKGEKFSYKSDERLRRAIEKKIFEDNRNNIKLTTFTGAQTDSENLKKLEAIKNRLIDEYGYCHHCAADIMNYIGGLLARGDINFD